MKKKKINLSKKLILQKSPVAELNGAQQGQLRGGAGAATGTNCPGGTLLITDCLATAPSPRHPCVICP
jgi:hypothetical protein